MVIGAGTMGAGIAGLLAQKCKSVIVKDTALTSLQRGKEHLRKIITKRRNLSSFERATILNKIDWLQYNSETVKRSDIVIEAVFENMELKKSIFQGLASQVSSKCILASNTSSLSVSEMASSISNPERFIGMHFFNPVERMPLVELIYGEQTSEETIHKTAALSVALGKFPIIVKDVPGFLVNRILIPYLNEAVYLLEQGYSVTEIDSAALAFGMPMGPIRLLDEVGLDVAAHVSEIMIQGYGERMAVPPFAKTLMESGRLGKKNKKGFYDYSSREPLVWEGLTENLGLSETAAPTNRDEQYIQERLIFHLVNEAMKCLYEGVAGSDIENAEKQIDLGMVMGIGFPPFRGGVMHYAHQLGLEKVRQRLHEFADHYGVRYVPWEEPGASASNGR
jgi:3-hydroxyacyl-CoA dehydrogenase/enoyl-CoA hydratase/3-hydroxybutyryl-CoA epimerase